MKNSVLKIISAITVLAIVIGCVCTSFASEKIGDIDSNGKVNSDDALIIVKHSVGIKSDIDESILDIDEDGAVTSCDALTVLQIAVGIIVPEEPTTEPTTKEDPTEPTSEDITEPATEEPTSEDITTEPTTEEPTEPPTEKPVDPTLFTKKEIISAYNDAVNKAVGEKAGYKKTRTSVLGTLEGAEKLMKVSLVKNAVDGFLGIGENTYTNKKGSADYLVGASLSGADVKSAKCEKLSGNVYRITMTLADGRSTAPSVNDNSPLIRTGIFFGKDCTNLDYDYKSAENIYTGINSTGEATVKSVVQDTSNTVVTADIDMESGRISALSVDWAWKAQLTDIKYTIIKVSGTGNATTSVSYCDFEW